MKMEILFAALTAASQAEAMENVQILPMGTKKASVKLYGETHGPELCYRKNGNAENNRALYDMDAATTSNWQT